MPRVGMLILSANVIEWKKQVNDYVNIKDPLFVVESEMGVIEYRSLFEGILKAIIVPEGKAMCGDVIALIGDEDEEVVLP